VRIFLVFGVNKLGKHRSRLQILESILSVISGNEGAKKTQIMYQAYLSYKLLTRYLNDVLNAGLVVCDNKNCFRLTPKGEKFLARFGEYHQSREVVEKNLNHVEDQKLILEEMCPNCEAVDVGSRNGEKDRV
jgi:predicted transcriptional regulator